MSTSSRNRDYQAIFRRDAEAILIAFTEMRSSSFKDFSKIWQNFKAYMIFGLKDFIPNVFRFFLEDAIKVINEYIGSPEFNYYTRIGALYIYHVIFHSQSTYPKTKARLTFSSWENLSTFIDNAKLRNDKEVVYVFETLVKQSAFHYVSDNNEVSFVF
ncbi:hypothetical protein GJ496_006597 [Pomphorhynchus laevis]|nr:hypothetical protein GJ496_006597 [Pomphorhynchus laevis]